MPVSELRRATLNLHVDVARWVIRALDSGWFQIEPGAYEMGGGGGVCPIVAGATMAGVWSDGQLLSDSEAWGSRESPTDEIEEFAAYFDLCAEELGVASAIDLVRTTLAGATHHESAPIHGERTASHGW